MSRQRLPLDEALEALLDPSQRTVWGGTKKLQLHELQTIAASLPFSHVSELNLSFNQAGDAGALAFAEVLPQSTLSAFLFTHNNVSASALEPLIEVIPQTCLTQLSLRGNQLLKEQAERIEQALKANLDRIGELWRMLRDPLTKPLKKDEWRDAVRLAPAIAAEAETRNIAVEPFIRDAAERALADGLDPQGFVLRALPLPQAMAWCKEQGRPLKAPDLLNGTMCQGGLRAMCQQPELWDDVAQLREAYQALPDAPKPFIGNYHQLTHELARRNAPTQNREGRA